MEYISDQIATYMLPKKTWYFLWPKQTRGSDVQRRIPLFCTITLDRDRHKREAINQIYMEVKGSLSKFISVIGQPLYF